MGYKIFLDGNGDPNILEDSWGFPEDDDLRLLTEEEFEKASDAYAYMEREHPSLIVNAKALSWWNAEFCFADEPTNPRWKLSEYRQDQGGIEALCPVADVCPLLNEKRACHGIVWCNVYNGGWSNSHGFRPHYPSPEVERESLLGMLESAQKAKRYAEKKL